MSDEAAFAAAVAADPAADLPRLVFADWLDDHDQPDRAEFVRAQVRAAATPAWEPFAVYCRHRRPEWTTGDPWRSTLPPVDGWAVEWHPDRAFSRGFGYSLIVRDLNVFLADAPRLFDAAPVGELHLPTGTLDQWRAVGRAAWLPRVKSVHFYGTTTPIEPVRVLCESPLATGIEEIVFEVCSRPGMPVLLDGLFASAVGRRLKRLTFRNGPLGETDDFIDAICRAPDLKLDALGFANVAPSWGPRLGNLSHCPLVLGAAGLAIADMPDGGEFLRLLAGRWEMSRLRTLRMNRSQIPAEALLEIAFSDSLLPLRSLDLGDQPRAAEANIEVGVADADNFDGLHGLCLAKSNLGDPTAAILCRAECWPTLHELDLRDNRITDAGAAPLLAAPVPADLTALLLGGNPISEGMRSKLRRHFGPAVIFDD